MEVAAGVYDLLIESVGYEPLKMPNQSFTSSVNLGLINVKESNQTLNEVVVKGQKASMELNLDKRIFNVGTDLANKGATAAEILGNLPSIQVDPEGAIKLRGSDNVRILIDGKPSTLAGINGSSGLQSLQGNLIDKVEIITNPSARYEAEGGGGIINIILKKGKNQGMNGTFIGNVGDPKNNSLNGTLNYKTKEFNLFTTQGYGDRNNPGNAIVNSRYLNDDNSTRDFMNENRTNERLSKAYNGSFGMDWFLDKSLTWTNIVNLRRSVGDNTDNVFQNYYDQDFVYDYKITKIEKDSYNDNNDNCSCSDGDGWDADLF